MTETLNHLGLFGNLDISKQRLFKASSYPSLFNQFCSIIYRAGFKKVKIEERVDNAVQAEQTLMIMPRISGVETFIDDNLVSYLKAKYVKHKLIYLSFANHTLSSKIPEGCTPITVTQKENIINIGYVNTANNYTVMFYNPLATTLRIGFMKEVLSLFLDAYNLKNVKYLVSPEDLKRMSEQFKAKAIEAFMNYVQSNVNKKRAKIIEILSAIDNHNINMLQLYRDQQSILLEIDKLEEFKAKNVTYFQDSMAEVKKFAFVKDIYFSQEGINIYFGKISIGNVYIGDFTAVITPEKIFMKNPHRRFNHEHPHVNDGRCCFGNISTKINELHAAMRLKELVFLLYQFLNTYSEKGGPYSRLADWKDFRKTENKFDEFGNIKTSQSKAIEVKAK